MLTFSGFRMKGHVFGVTTMHIFSGESLSRREIFVSHGGLEKLNIVRTNFFFMRNKCDQVYND
jgi:hypothetical protein